VCQGSLEHCLGSLDLLLFVYITIHSRTRKGLLVTRILHSCENQEGGGRESESESEREREPESMPDLLDSGLHSPLYLKKVYY
jgi:hypothetical protein